MFFPVSYATAKPPNKRLQKENHLRDMYKKCARQFPNLDAETRAWFNRYRKGKAFLNLPYDLRVKMRNLKKRRGNEFRGKLPVPHNALAVERTRQKEKKKPACLLSDEEMAAIAGADAFTRNSVLIKYWAGLLSDYVVFEKENYRPSTRSENSNERRLANGYIYCRLLARQGKLPLEIEILYSKINPSFDLMGLWKQKLERCGRILSETGESPLFSSKQQRDLAYWHYVVSCLHQRGALPKEAAWLAENFKPISELNGYLALARTIGEEKITNNSNIGEATKWAEWRDEVKRQHSAGLLSPDIVSHFKACSNILKG